FRIPRMASKLSLVLLLVFCAASASAGLIRPPCHRLEHIVPLPYLAPRIADIGRCSDGCVPDTFAPMQILYLNEATYPEVQNESVDIVVRTCKPRDQ
ncbi:hypothetical protein PMAYCL1PPCAC_32649, partial [Pristionchus mayeri]